MGGEDQEYEEQDGARPSSPSQKPKLRLRHDGFTPAKRRRFLKTLRKTGVVLDACRVVGISSTSAYRTKKKLPDFAALWDSAQAMAGSEIETLAWQRGVEGLEEPVYYYGKFSHMIRKRSDAIFRMILMASNPKKYGRMGALSREEALKKARRQVMKGMPRVATNEEVREALQKALVAFAARRKTEKAEEAARANPEAHGDVDYRQQPFEPGEGEAREG